jgi:hypothetical protein
MDHADDFDRLTEDLDPYHAFLRFGHVSAHVEDPAEWRAEIRRQARRDNIRMRSFVLGERSEGLHRVWAGQTGRVNDDLLTATFQLLDVQYEAEARAKLRGHERLKWLQVSHTEEAAGRCRACGGRVYVSRLREPPIVDGDVFETDCR